MTLSCKSTLAFLDNNGIKYVLLDDERSVVRISYSGENKETIAVLVIFDKDNTSAQLVSTNYCKFPAAKIDTMYKLCSDMNAQYRWEKFYVDSDDNTITIEDDAVIDVETSGQEILELVIRMIHIADEAYPKFMKTIW